ncbi:MAG: nitroreductase family protein [Nitrososphaerota archaeon]|nr:nitroreductase family protein [Nitrososphaerota archaeon]
MDTLEVIKGKIEVREFSDAEIPFEDQIKVLEAGRFAASAYNKQEWRFILINDKGLLKKVGDLAPTGPYISTAAFAIAVYLDKDVLLATIDGTRAVQNMMLAGWYLGLGSCWVDGLKRDDISKLLGAPDNMRLFTVIPFGKPKKKLLGKKTRKPLEEIAYVNRFGNKLGAY